MPRCKAIATSTGKTCRRQCKLDHMCTQHKNANNKECPICFENIEHKIMATLSCHDNHCFHNTCIMHWISSKNGSRPTCPICREPIHKYVIDNRHFRVVNNRKGI